MTSVIKLLLSTITLQIIRVVSASNSCSVQVQPTWPMIINVPSQPSIVMIDCLPDAFDGNSWRIGRNRSDGVALRFSEQFHMYGIYLSEDTRFLIVNDTAVNNNTLIRCSGSQSAVARETRLSIYKPTLNVIDIGAQRVNISWSQLPPSFNTTEYFNLTIISSKNHVIQESLVNRTFYEFSSDEDDSSCTNFTFSLSSNLSSPIYSGDCVSQSNVVQRPLPSLPNVTSVESSITYSLSKQPGGIVLTVSFLPGFACTNKYRVTHYTIEIMGQNGVIKSNSTNEFNSVITITANELNEDANYSFQIITSNNVGNRSTGYETFYTTDVQRVTATALENENAFEVQCSFITGSNAQGCMVVLVGNEQDNITTMLTRNYSDCNNCSQLNTTVNVTANMRSNCYDRVFGFDIEFDGSVGTLAIPGKIMSDCSPTENNVNIPGATPDLRIIISVVITVAFLLLLFVSMLIISILAYYCFYKVKRNSLKQSITTTPINKHNEEEEDDENMPGPVYDLPLKQTTKKKIKNGRTVDDTADHHYNITSHIDSEEKPDVNSSNNNNYAELNEETDVTEHHYFVLENNGGRPQKKSEDITPDPDAPALPPPFKPDPPPVYQDINNLSYRQEETEQNKYATVQK